MILAPRPLSKRLILLLPRRPSGLYLTPYPCQRLLASTPPALFEPLLDFTTLLPHHTVSLSLDRRTPPALFELLLDFTTLLPRPTVSLSLDRRVEIPTARFPPVFGKPAFRRVDQKITKLTQLPQSCKSARQQLPGSPSPLPPNPQHQTGADHPRVQNFLSRVDDDETLAAEGHIHRR